MTVERDKVVDTTDKDLPKKDRVIDQALERFKDAMNSEAENREEATEDLRMAAGKDHWPAEIVRSRELENRPVLTINKLASVADRIVNESRINPMSIKVVPTSKGATDDIAQVFNGLIKSIENESDAEVAYQHALEGAVYSGFGYFRIDSSYVDETSFDQELTIDRIKNNMSVYMDPTRVKHDGSDCRFLFVTEMISREEYKVRYPGKDPPVPLESGEYNEARSNWVSETMVRVGEYWVKEPREKTLLLLSDGRTVEKDEWDAVLPSLLEAEEVYHIAPDPQTGQPTPVEGPAPEGSDFPEQILNEVPEVVRTRTVASHVVRQYFIDGEKVIEGPTDWPGYYIPIVPVWGKEMTIDDETIYRSSIRFAKDPQRVYNYFRTAATETVALAPKAPYVIAHQQVEGFEEEWENANKGNRGYLPYNHVQGLNAPQREMVSQTAVGEITESNISSDEIKATTSIYDASLGDQGNETSGRAISQRNLQSSITNMSFADNLRRSIKYAGKILVDLIPRIYDTERQIVIIDPEEKQRLVTVNQVVEKAASGEKEVINDLTQGRYGVTVTTGPSYATLRQESAESMMDFVRTAPETATAVIDLIAENQDWPGATKIANRLRKLFLPPGVDEDGPMPPKEPTLDETLKKLKAQGTAIGNEKKKLDVVEKRKDLTNNVDDLVSLVNALKGLGVLNENDQQTDQQTDEEGG